MKELSRKILMALVNKGVEIPRECILFDIEGIEIVKNLKVPDLSLPENLHILLQVADSLGKVDIHCGIGTKICLFDDGKRLYFSVKETRSEAVLEVLRQALGL